MNISSSLMAIETTARSANGTPAVKRSVLGFMDIGRMSSVRAIETGS
jgi:hypothetical protein